MIGKYGIDFGTTNSSIAFRYLDENENEDTVVVDLKGEQPNETIESIFCISEDGMIAVGKKAADKLYHSRPKGKARIIKKIKMELENNPDQFKFNVGSKHIDGVDIIAQLFKFLKDKAEKAIEFEDLDVLPDGVVMGVPVQYGDKQKKILIDALLKAGYYSNNQEANEKTEFVSEPVAVAVHYGLTNTEDKTIMVFDFGGGTLDVAVLNLKEQVGDDYLHPHKVKAKGRLTLGGEKLSELLFTKIFCGKQGYGTHKICKAFGLNENMTPEELWQEITENDINFDGAVNNAKHGLSFDKKYDFAYEGDNDISLDKIITVTRKMFEDAISDEIDKIDDLIDSVLEQADIDDKYEIDNVIIAGGSSLIPCVQQKLFDIFGYKKVVTDPSKGHKKNIAQKEVLTSIVRGLAAVGWKRHFDDVIDCDYGVWIDARNKFDPILKKGLSVKEASVFDKPFQAGNYGEYITQHKEQASVEMQIFQSNVSDAKNPYSKLGTIHIEDSGGKEYRVFMHIEPKQGILLVDIYDTKKKRWIKIPKDEREIIIKIKN